MYIFITYNIIISIFYIDKLKKNPNFFKLNEKQIVNLKTTLWSINAGMHQAGIKIEIIIPKELAAEFLKAPKFEITIHEYD